MNSFFRNALFISLLGAGSVAKAESTVLTVCNHNTDRAIYAAYMNDVGAASGWQSNGWFKVAINQCYNLTLGNYAGTVYMYAKDEFGQTDWGDTGVAFCVNKTNAFQINNADTAACSDSTLQKVASEAVTVKAGNNTWDVYPNFSQLNFCNQNASIPVFATLARPVNGVMQSEGWFEVDAGKCHLAMVGKYTGVVEYYGEYNGGQFAWQGTPGQYCVNRTSAFNLSHADDATTCTDATLKMVKARQVTVPVGTTTVNFESVNMDTVLQLCNKTTNETLQASYATATANSTTLWASSGWQTVPPGQCVSVDLGSYTGKVEIYGEVNAGQTYWGSGPFNFCVNRTQNFTIADSTNQTTCNSNVSFKMVPASDFTVTPGPNTFNFTP